MAKKMINFVNDDGSKVLIETNAPDLTGDEPPGPRLRKVPVVVTQHDLDAIKDAISLKRAMLRSWTMLPADGEILTMICEEWMKAESARLSGKGGA